MIHYHGTPIGGDKIGAIRFLNGRHALVSFEYPKDLGAVLEACQSFVLDNGAFTVWKRGGTLDRDGYYTWVDDYYKHPSFDWAIIPDVIGGSEDENNKLLEEWPKHLNGVPVYHIHESLERLKWLCDNYKIVALGSSGEYPTPNASIWWDRMSIIMNYICDENGRPPCKFHGLRMLNPKVFTKLPLSSGDSVNAAINNNINAWKTKLGEFTPVSAWQRSSLIADRVESFNSAPFWGGTGFGFYVNENDSIESGEIPSVLSFI